MDPSRPIAYLYLLPIELWLACWISCSRRQLRRLSLVCQCFRSVCLSLLLEQQCADVGAIAINIANHNWLDSVHRLHRIAVRLDKLAETPRVLMVKSWKITLERVPSGVTAVSRTAVFDGLRDRVSTTFSAKLGLYQNLVSLELRGIIFDARLRSTLDSLPRFQELTLDSHYIAPRNGTPLKLKRLTICGPPGHFPRTNNDSTTQDSLTIVSPVRLVQLNLHAGGELSSMVAGFGRKTLPCLVDLSLHDPSDFDLLRAFLKQCPQLESLAIKSVDVALVTAGREPLHPDAVPLLQKLTAPARIIGLFTPNRPINAVTVLSNNPHNDIMGPEDLKSVFLIISHTTFPLRSLSICRTSSTLKTSADIIAIFPDLKYLSIAVPEKDIAVSQWLCGGPFINTFRPHHAEDAISPELNDETAFDNPPTDEISDCEDDFFLPWPHEISISHRQNHVTEVSWSQSPLERASPNYYTFVQNVQWRIVSFPPNLEALRLRVPFSVGNYYSEEHDELVASLSRQYPLLREVAVEYDSSESVWEVSGFGSYSCTKRNRRK